MCDGKKYWGVGIHEDIIHASINALVVAVNKLPQLQENAAEKDDRLIAMLNYIQAHYQTVTLEDMANEFHLSTPYVSKFIREKSGKTFGEQVTQVRMKKAKTLLRNGNMTIENISYSIGYPNAEHFSRVFKKVFDVSPAQYRKIATKQTT
jgi:2-isopropylmalate synthase